MKLRIFVFLVCLIIQSGLATAEFLGVSAVLSLEQRPEHAQLILFMPSTKDAAGFEAFIRETEKPELYQFAVSGVRPELTQDSKVWLLLDFVEGSSGIYELSWGEEILALEEDPQQLRSQVIALQTNARELQQSNQLQVQELKRAKSDLEIVASVDRIIELEEVSEQSKKELELIDADVASAKKALQTLGREPAPRNYGTRLHQLTTQLAEIATLVQGTESEEHLRRTKSEEELRYINEVIEATSFESVDELQKELQILQERRYRLQSKLGFTSEELRDFGRW
ncbi:MAG: hypothetical protein KDD62_09110 [Bdellovibrionales bacterium]|nr:hypothetical protein [Bdellovibrionales bacterium]